MNDNASPQIDRITELLADRALFGLDAAEQQELDRLRVDSKDIDFESLERIAAAAQLASLGEIQTLPSELASKLAAQAQAEINNAAGSTQEVASQTTTITPPVSSFPRRELIAWFAAAAAVAFALLSVTRQSPSAADLRAELLALANTEAAELTRVTWTATEDPTAKAASGEVVWHNGRQQGVMKFTGLPANDPTVEQYQLWIFDEEQNASYPIDGGVFDIPATKQSANGTTEVLVKIDAKLPVVKPTMFAITIEKPGGVVVSSRERLPLLAKVESD